MRIKVKDIKVGNSFRGIYASNVNRVKYIIKLNRSLWLPVSLWNHTIIIQENNNITMLQNDVELIINN